MVVILHKKVEVEGKMREIESFLPDDALLTNDVIEQARNVDAKIKSFCDTTNKEYDRLPKETQKNALMKWRWLGEQLDLFFKSEYLIQKADISRNIIWPAVGQYLRAELSGGIGTKRSGTPKDHYRKCYILATSQGTDWFNSWLAWDAFIDRADQLVEKKELLLALKKAFNGLILDVKDFQLIAKLTVEALPSATANPVVLASISQDEIKKTSLIVKRKFESIR